MDAESHLKRLIALRDMLQAEIDELGKMVYPDGPPGTSEECRHPDNQRIDLRTLGSGINEHWLCKVCGYEHNSGEE